MLLLPAILILAGWCCFTKHLGPDEIVTIKQNKVISRESVTTTQQPVRIAPTDRLSTDGNPLPTLANGHLGFTVFGDAIYMNELYSGRRGLSHRARIANVANVRLLLADADDATKRDGNGLTATMRMDFKSGTFCVDYRGPNNSYRAEQLIYAHQFYNRAIVNQFTIERLTAEADIRIALLQPFPSPASEDIIFNFTETVFIDRDAERERRHRRRRRFRQQSAAERPPISPGNRQDEYSTTRTVRRRRRRQSSSVLYKVHRTCGSTAELEDPAGHPNQPRRVCVLWNHVPEELTLKRSERTVSYKFIMTADESARFAEDELREVLNLNPAKLLLQHSKVWQNFWRDFDIHLKGNHNLEQVIRSSIYYLMSNFPLSEPNRPSSRRQRRQSKAYQFGGLSPTGLGRGGANLDDYEGHSFWDTEIWMFPVVNLIETKFTRMLIDYRYRRMLAAEQNAKESGYRGVRYPWESASSGIEVTQPCCPEVAEFQHHITADISFALRQFFAATQDFDWLQTQGCAMARKIADFWESRVSEDPVTGLYDIVAVMGPDEDHVNVTNNAYTNVVAAYALYFGDLTECLCSNDDRHHDGDHHDLDDDNGMAPTDDVNGRNRSALARKIKLLYDTKSDYNPQFEGYRLGTPIKQADTVLLGYPLQYRGLTTSTKSNNLRFYEPVTRRTGPAMTWAMHAINHLDLNNMEKAVENFKRSFQNYVRGPHRVWNEVEVGQRGATNFLTGAGGFLQAVIYGFGGLRLHLDRLQIWNPRLPPNMTEFEIKGFKYLHASFTLKVTKHIATLEATRISRKLTIQGWNKDEQFLVQKQIYNITNTTIIIKSFENVYKTCSLPEDLLTPIESTQTRT
ncbi:protein-glucosylgalactosylhydroxylysine glucosidase-like [Sabethes cyaneus]|uniref:protein-glucosylgalactosylhydroxylysine glucosidase-like n=1 Tax=Sabethes cyaneus TaxID=53552 RepID=UPI00237DA9F6|nr:protein-glucosylgalactosylhydroxylysine glucosidase-like [Sabethes cyaneus]